MAVRAARPLLVGAAAAISLAAGCKRPAPHNMVDAAAPVPVLLTRYLETRAVDSAPSPPPDLKSTPAVGAQGRRAGGVPEVLNVADDCSVHAVWWAAHLCGLTVKGDARWEEASGWAFTSVKIDGTARFDCPAQVTRFETVITGLSNGNYRFGSSRKYVEFVIGCAKGR